MTTELQRLTSENQRMTGEISVYRELLKKAGNMIDSSLDHDDLPGYETADLEVLVTQIHDALHLAGNDLLEAI